MAANNYISKVKKRNLRSTPDDCVKTIKNSYLRKSNQTQYLNAKTADVRFIVEDVEIPSGNSEIPAHKDRLSICSAFETMFFGSIPEKNEVKIIDEGVNADMFKEFLQFFYLKDVKLSMENIHGVMYLCHKYQTDECLDMCSMFLKEHLTNDEVCLYYQLATLLEQTDLKEFCQHKISMNAKKVFQSEGFLNCSWETLMEIVKMDELVCREISLLDACIDWALNSCKCKKLNIEKRNVRDQLKDVIYEIRFYQITVNDIDTLKMNASNPYIDAELEEIMAIAAKETLFSSKFNCSSRSIPFNDAEKLVCKRWEKRVNNYCIPNNSSTIFSSNKPLYFGEFDVYLLYDSNIHCEISIQRMDTGMKMIETFTEEISSDIEYVHPIALPKPIIIEENIKHKIQIIFFKDIYGRIEWKQEAELSNGALITFHRDTSTDFDNVSHGVIAYLSFNEINF